MASKDEDLYYEFLYPKICIGPPIHLCSLLFAGAASALALCKFVCPKLVYENVCTATSTGPHKIIFQQVE